MRLLHEAKNTQSEHARAKDDETTPVQKSASIKHRMLVQDLFNGGARQNTKKRSDEMEAAHVMDDTMYEISVPSG